MFNREENNIPELKIGVNLIRNDQKFYKLPLLRANGYFMQDGDTVELVILNTNQISIETYERPMRYGKYYNNRVFFNTMTDQFRINPKFVFDGEAQTWVLMNAGYVCFAELELEYKTGHKVYGGKDA
jgi:hypothetical protein